MAAANRRRVFGWESNRGLSVDSIAATRQLGKISNRCESIQWLENNSLKNIYINNVNNDVIILWLVSWLIKHYLMLLNLSILIYSRLLVSIALCLIRNCNRLFLTISTSNFWSKNDYNKRLTLLIIRIAIKCKNKNNDTWFPVATNKRLSLWPHVNAVTGLYKNTRI